MSTYFKNFPLVKYSFGDQEPLVYFQKISTSVDLIDVLKEQVSLYTKQTILDNERPDTFSYKLYGTSDYYWTFFLMNDKLRESGWPLPSEREYEVLYERYPNYTMTTDSFVATTFPEGTIVKTSTGYFATVVRKKLDLGQIIIKPNGLKETYISEQNSYQIVSASPLEYPNNFTGVTSISYSDGSITQIASVWLSQAEYNAAHHYENSNGEYVDVNPYSQDRSGKKLITIKDFFQAKNNDLKEIIVLKPEIVDSVAGEFKKLLRT